jgi:SAM-dependent methyltransferase
MDATKQETIRQAVRTRYSQVAAGRSTGCCGGSSGCGCGGSPVLERYTEALGYGKEDLAAVPEGANLGLGCGNPQTLAAIQPGETVLDLGAGAGFDAFLAARQVGPEGRVIGVDMTPDMVAKARANAAQAAMPNVEFRLGEIEHLPVADASVDVILSNCVINLSPDKPAVFREAFRVLKPRGRLAVSDVVALGPLPPEVQAQLDLIAGCVAGAAQVADLEQTLTDCGFEEVRVTVRPESRGVIQEWFPGSGIEDRVASAAIEARKPRA